MEDYLVAILLTVIAAYWVIICVSRAIFAESPFKNEKELR